MGRSGPTGQHLYHQLCGRLLQQLGQQVRGTCCTDLGQRSAVLLGGLGGAVLHPRHISSTHYSIPPSGERVSGEVSQAAKGGPASEAGQPGLALPPPLGHAGTQDSPKGGLRPLISGNGVWRGPYLTWRVFGGLYTTWGQLPTAATREDEPVPASTHETGRGQAGLSAGGCPPQGGLRVVKRGAVASSLSPLYLGPYRVISRGEKTFHVDTGGRDEVISADRLKPHLGQAPVQPASPPKRGRPPASPSGGVGGQGRPPE